MLLKRKAETSGRSMTSVLTLSLLLAAPACFANDGNWVSPAAYTFGTCGGVGGDSVPGILNKKYFSPMVCHEDYDARSCAVQGQTYLMRLFDQKTRSCNQWVQREVAQCEAYIRVSARECDRLSNQSNDTHVSQTGPSNKRSRSPAAAPPITPISFGPDFPSPARFYPDASRRLAEQGKVVVSVCVGPRGELTSSPMVVASSGFSRLDAAAIGYAWATSGHWRPARRNGVPVTRCTQLPIQFGLQY